MRAFIYTLTFIFTFSSMHLFADEQSYSGLRMMTSQAKKAQKSKKKTRSAKKGTYLAQRWAYKGFLDSSEGSAEAPRKAKAKKQSKKNAKTKNKKINELKNEDQIMLDLISTETTSLNKQKQSEAAPKKWGVSLISENMKNMTSDNPAGYNGDIFAVQTATFKYKFDDTLSGQIAQDWYQLYGYGQNKDGEENKHDLTVQDLSFRVTKVKVLKTNDLTWLIQGRYYAPTSEASQNVGQLGQLRLYFIGETEITPQISASLLTSPRYFIQRNKSIDNEDGSETNTNQWRILNSLGFKYSFNDIVALETTGGVYSKKKHNRQMQHFQDYSTSIYLNYSLFSLNFGIRASDEALDIRDNGLEFYNHRVSEYFAIFSISI